MMAAPGTVILWHEHACRGLRDDLMPEARVVDLLTGEVATASDRGAQCEPEPPAQLLLMPLPEAAKQPVARNKNGGRKKTGHAGVPGTGPAGETCGGCTSYRVAHRGAGVYRKCALMRSHWTKGPGSDIRSGDAACSRWETKRGTQP